MRAQTTLIVLAAALAGALAGCSSDGQSPTPRRHAYPRVVVSDSVYHSADSFSPHFEINAAVRATRPAPGQLTIDYPAYGAVVYVTSRRLPPGELEAELDNRRERISLNLNGVSATTEHLRSANGRFECALVTARDVSATPVQFLATDGEGCLVSGAAYFANVSSGTSADSIAPIVAALRRDLRHALLTLDLTDPD